MLVQYIRRKSQNGRGPKAGCFVAVAPKFEIAKYGPNWPEHIRAQCLTSQDDDSLKFNQEVSTSFVGPGSAAHEIYSLQQQQQLGVQLSNCSDERVTIHSLNTERKIRDNSYRIQKVIHPDMVYIGYSVCRKSDIFDKSLAKRLATIRAIAGTGMWVSPEATESTSVWLGITNHELNPLLLLNQLDRPLPALPECFQDALWAFMFRACRYYMIDLSWVDENSPLYNLNAALSNDWVSPVA